METFEGFLDDFDKIKGFSEEIFNSKKIFLDKDGRDMKNAEYNLENCKFINIEESNKRKQHQMKKFFITDEKTGKTEMFFNQSECSKNMVYHSQEYLVPLKQAKNTRHTVLNTQSHNT